MPEAEVIYSEVQFDRGARRCTNATTPSSDEVIYSDVRILESEAPAELPDAGKQRPAQVRRRDVALLVLSLLLAAAVSAMTASLIKNVQPKDQLQKLQFDLEALKRNLSDLENVNVEIKDELQKLKSCNEDLGKKVSDESCLKCEKGWEQHGGRCYRFSSSLLPWTKSRESCNKQGGDLVKIDSKEEQTFLQNKVGERRKYPGEEFWIGLTDFVREGQWKWTDNSPLDESLSFWADNQPDDSKGEDHDGEDCVRMGEKWFDKTCKDKNRWICEKHTEQKGRFHVCKSV